MKKKHLLLFFICTLLISLFTGCRFLNNGGNVNEETEVTPSPEKAIYSAENSATLVYDEGGVTKENLDLLKNRLTEKTGRFILTKSSSIEKTGNEIVLGRTSRDISKKAYSYLERIDTSTRSEVRYVIYSDGRSVAIAYDDAFYGSEAAQSSAISHFIEKYCISSSLSMESGIYAKEILCAIEYQSEIDEKEKEAKWQNAYEKLAENYSNEFADEAIGVLKKHNSLFSDGAISWITDLFDPAIGGFYYSNSARDTEGYLPDLESTAQAVGFLMQSGVLEKYGGSIKDGTPEWFSDSVVAFVKGLQDPYNGYFYHPQWSREDSDKNLARLGRDESSAVRLLERFGATPYYDTPSGIDGEYDYGIKPTSKLLLGKLDSSSVISVSKVLAVNSEDSAVPAHLRSEHAFRSYLDGMEERLKKDDYWVGNHFESQATQIVARDKVLKERGEEYSLADILADWFTSKQNERGTWAQPTDDIYDEVNGVLKISSTFSRIGKQVPNAELGLRRAIEALTSEVPIGHVCDILNPWYAIITLRANIESYTNDDSSLNEILSGLTKNYSEAVKATTEKLTILLRPDGSFGYLPESSSPTSQEMPVAVPDSYEGDVNATSIAILSIAQHMFATIGISYIGPYSEADRLFFVSRIDEIGAVIKDDVPPSEPITFDDEQIDHSSVYAKTIFASSGQSTVTADPTDSNNRVLLIDSYSGGTDQIMFENSKTLIRGTCFVFDLDMYVSSETANGDIAQMLMSSSLYMLQISHKNGKVIFAESSSTNSSNAAVYKLGEVANDDEWFNVRVEYYPGDDDTVRIKLFVNGKLLSISDNYYDGAGNKLLGSGTPGTKYTEAKFIMFSSQRVKVYVDNVTVEQMNTEYKPPKAIEELPLLRSTDGLDGEPVINGFEDGEIPENMTASGATVAETAMGKALHFSSNGNYVIADALTRGYGTNAACLETKIFAPDTLPIGSTLSVDFLSWDGDKLMMSVKLTVSEDGSGKFLKVTEGINGSVISETRIPLGKAFRLRIEYFFKKSITAVYVDGILAGATFTGVEDSNAMYFGKVKLSASAGDFSVDELCIERANAPLLEDSYRIVNDFASGFGNASASSSVIINDNAASFEKSKNGDTITFPVNNRTTVPSTFTAELVLKFGERFRQGSAFRITLLDKNNLPMLAYDIVGEDGLIKIYSVTENGRYTDTPTLITDIIETFTVKFSKRLEVAILYTDGICKATTDIAYSDGSLSYEYAFVEVSALDGYNDFAVVSCICESSIKNFTLDKPTITDKSEMLDFENSSSIDLPSEIANSFNSRDGGLKVFEAAIADTSKKALYIKTTEGNEDTMTVSPTSIPENFPEAVGFESELLILPGATNFELRLDPVCGSTPACRIVLTVGEDGKISLSAADISKPVIAHVGEWFKLTLRYTVPGADLNGDGFQDIKLEVSINGAEEPIATSYAPFGSIIIPAHLTAIRFTYSEASDAAMFIDNVFVGGLPEDEITVGIPNTDPNFKFDEESGDTITDGGDGDEDGWTSDTPSEGDEGSSIPPNADPNFKLDGDGNGITSDGKDSDDDGWAQ